MGDAWETTPGSRAGGPTPIARPIYLELALQGAEADQGGQVDKAIVPQVPTGVVAIELARNSTCGPILVNREKVLEPGECYFTGSASMSELELESAYSILLASGGKGGVPTGNYGFLRPVARIVLHRDPRTVPPTATRSNETQEVSEDNFPLTAVTESELCQIVADGFRTVVVVAWALAQAYDARVELVWTPRPAATAVPWTHTEVIGPVVVPVGATTGVVVYDGPTRGCSIIRLTGTAGAVAGTAKGLIRLTP